jgi:flagellar biosynthesis/type III secretory pathway protein FliH
MRDVEAHARAILAQAREQAEALLAAAQEQGEALKAEAYAQGMEEGQRDGFAQGQLEGAQAGAQQALTEHQDALTTLVNALAAAAMELDASRRQLEAEGLREVVSLSIAIARRVTKRQGMIDPETLTENLTEAMKLVAHAADVRVAINPKQKTVLEAALPRLQLQWPELKHVELVEEQAIAPGGCRIYIARGHVDADLDSQLDRVVADLLPRDEEAAAS